MPMDALHRAAFPGSDGLRPAAHVALADLIGARTNPESFPGALARAAEDDSQYGMKRWGLCALCNQGFNGKLALALGWACWKTHRPVLHRDV